MDECRCVLSELLADFQSMRRCELAVDLCACSQAFWERKLEASCTNGTETCIVDSCCDLTLFDGNGDASGEDRRLIRRGAAYKRAKDKCGTMVDQRSAGWTVDERRKTRRDASDTLGHIGYGLAFGDRIGQGAASEDMSGTNAILKGGSMESGWDDVPVT